MRLPILFATAFLLTASAQPKIGILDFYGQHKVSTERIRKALGVKEGDVLPPSKVDLEERLDKLEDVSAAHVEAACCAGPEAILYVGIEERGGLHFETRELEAGEEMVLPKADNVEELRRAVHKAEEASVRADAAALLGDTKVSQQIIDDLQYAARDFDATVRRAAVRSLVKMSIAVRSADPDLRLMVQPTWMIEMLNSVVWSDRRAATEALMELTETHDPTLLAKIKERAFDSLVQMAQWKFLEHALPPYLLLCRIGAIPDKEAQDSWSAGERDKVIARVQKEARKK